MKIYMEPQMTSSYDPGFRYPLSISTKYKTMETQKNENILIIDVSTTLKR